MVFIVVAHIESNGVQYAVIAECFLLFIMCKIMFLLKLPEDLIRSELEEWIDLKEFGLLDVVISDKPSRCLYHRMLSKIMVNWKQKRTSNCLFSWAHDRGLIVDFLNLEACDRLFQNGKFIPKIRLDLLQTLVIDNASVDNVRVLNTTIPLCTSLKSYSCNIVRVVKSVAWVIAAALGSLTLP